MTDDELDRALFALPLEEPPGDLRALILSATIARPKLTVRAWEVWLVGTLFACMVWLTFMVGTSVPDVGGIISRTVVSAVDRIAGSLSITTLVWAALGASFAGWISQLSFPQTRNGLSGKFRSEA